MMAATTEVNYEESGFQFSAFDFSRVLKSLDVHVQYCTLKDVPNTFFSFAKAFPDIPETIVVLPSHLQ
jgi:hypothetical protein